MPLKRAQFNPLDCKFGDTFLIFGRCTWQADPARSRFHARWNSFVSWASRIVTTIFPMNCPGENNSGCLFAGLLGRPMELLFGMEGRLASDSLIQAPRRTSATVAALMFSLSFVLIMATFSASIKLAFDNALPCRTDARALAQHRGEGSSPAAGRRFLYPAAVQRGIGEQVAAQDRRHVLRGSE